MTASRISVGSSLDGVREAPFGQSLLSALRREAQETIFERIRLDLQAIKRPTSISIRAALERIEREFDLW